MKAARSLGVATLAVGVLDLAGCGHDAESEAAPKAAAASASAATLPRLAVPDAPTAAILDGILEDGGITTAAFGVMKDGELAWSHVFGEVRPGVAATAQTCINVASITKTVVAETVLRLAADGVIDLDEPLAADFVDPDVSDDPQASHLTVRHVLSHSTGLPNWRFFTPGGRLAFEAAPGERYGYSGEGFEWLAHAIEARTGRGFPEIVRQTVLDPLGMQNTAFAVDPRAFGSIAEARDAEGVFHGHYCRPPSEGGTCSEAGRYNAAADMVTIVPDYAAFLHAVLDADGYGAEMAADRDTVLTPKTGDDRTLRCEADALVPCPAEQGYGLGFEVMAFEDTDVIGHRGVGLVPARRRLRLRRHGRRGARLPQRAERACPGRHARPDRGARSGFALRGSLRAGAAGPRSGVNPSCTG